MPRKALQPQPAVQDDACADGELPPKLQWNTFQSQAKHLKLGREGMSKAWAIYKEEYAKGRVVVPWAEPPAQIAAFPAGQKAPDGAVVASTGKRGASTGSKTQSTQQEAQAPSQSSGRSIRDYYQPKAITTKQAATAGIAPASQSPRAGSEASTGTVSYHSASTGQAQTPLRPIKAVRDDVGAGYAAHESPRAASSGVSSVTATPAPTRRPVASTGAQPTLPQAAPLLAHTGDVLATPGKRTLRGPKAPHAAPAPASDADVAPRGSGAASAAAAVAAAGVLAVGTLQPLSAAAASSMATQPPQYSGPSMEIMSTPQPYRTHMALQGVQQAVAPPLRAYGEDKLGGSLQSHQIDVTPTTGPVRRMAQANNMQTSPMVPSPGLGLVTASPSLPTLEVSDSPIITLPPSRMAPTRPIDPYSAFTAQPLPPTEPKKKSKNILRSSLKGIMKLLDRAKKNKGGGATPGQQGEHTTAPTTTTTTAITVPRIQYTPVTAPTDVNSSNSNVTVPRVQYSPAAVGTHNGEIDSATRVTVPRVQYTPVTVPYVESPAQTVRTGTQTMGQSPVASPMWQGDDDDEHRGAIRPASPGRATSGASGGLVPQSPVSAAATSPPPQPAPAAAAVGRVKRPPRPAALPASAPPAGTDVIDLLSDNEDDNTNTIIITTNTNTNNTNSTNSTSDASANKGVSFLSSKRGKGKGRDKAAQKGKDGLGGRMRRSVSDFANSVKTKVRSVLARDREGEGRGEGDDNTNMPHPEIAVLKAADFRTLRTRLRENTPNNHDRFFPGWTPWIMISGRNPRAVKDDVPPLPGVYEWGVLVPGRPRDEPIAFYLGKAGRLQGTETLRSRFDKYKPAVGSTFWGPKSEKDGKFQFWVDLQRRGFTLVYRHRHCHNIEPADYEDTLLRTLDYAANKVKNDKRRLLSLPGGHTMIDYPFVVAAPSY